MDISALSSTMATGGVAQQVDVGMLKALQNLEVNLTSELFATIGLGQSVDTHA